MYSVAKTKRINFVGYEFLFRSKADYFFASVCKGFIDPFFSQHNFVKHPNK
jgi:hypothetical protein